jgi:hypothetical protein
VTRGCFDWSQVDDAELVAKPLAMFSLQPLLWQLSQQNSRSPVSFACRFGPRRGAWRGYSSTAGPALMQPSARTRAYTFKPSHAAMALLGRASVAINLDIARTLHHDSRNEGVLTSPAITSVHTVVKRRRMIYVPSVVTRTARVAGRAANFSSVASVLG